MNANVHSQLNVNTVPMALGIMPVIWNAQAKEGVFSLIRSVWIAGSRKLHIVE